VNRKPPTPLEYATPTRRRPQLSAGVEFALMVLFIFGAVVLGLALIA
jgi:hypothetical protein